LLELTALLFKVAPPASMKPHKVADPVKFVTVHDPEMVNGNGSVPLPL
jgi:hypothetical protein